MRTHTVVFPACRLAMKCFYCRQKGARKRSLGLPPTCALLPKLWMRYPTVAVWDAWAHDLKAQAHQLKAWAHHLKACAHHSKAWAHHLNDKVSLTDCLIISRTAMEASIEGSAIPASGGGGPVSGCQCSRPPIPSGHHPAHCPPTLPLLLCHPCGACIQALRPSPPAFSTPDCAPCTLPSQPSGWRSGAARPWSACARPRGRSA